MDFDAQEDDNDPSFDTREKMPRGTMAQFELIDDFEMYKETKLEDVPQLP